MHRNREPLLHCAVFIEMTAPTLDALKAIQTEAMTELVRSKLNVDKLLLRQREGFQSVMPSGWNMFGTQFERVLPASSAANLYPFNYSGKTDPNGFYIGRDKFGSNIIVDLDRRSSDKTNANVLILGNSGQGKSYLLKLLLTNAMESGKSVIALDPENEYAELAAALGGCFIDLMSGDYIINPLEPKNWTDGADSEDTPETFRKSTKLSQHVSFLKDFFRSYKDFADKHIDALEIVLQKLYEQRGISDATRFERLRASDYPTLSDLYALIESEAARVGEDSICGAETLRELLLGLRSMCVGAESRFFNGHTNITSARFIIFGVKNLLQASANVRNALLFNALSYMSDRLLNEGRTVASIDELYLFLTNPTAIEYIRSFMKRVRKRDSAVYLASQNLEDFDVEGIRELTKPLFSIPTHAFLFNAGNIDKRFYIDSLQLEESEYNLIRYPQRGVCLYKCGNERYNLAVSAPPYKAELFGSAGGK
jgi:type IV secretory pathway VirB4 component